MSMRKEKKRNERKRNERKRNERKERMEKSRKERQEKAKKQHDKREKQRKAAKEAREQLKKENKYSLNNYWDNASNMDTKEIDERLNEMKIEIEEEREKENKEHGLFLEDNSNSDYEFQRLDNDMGYRENRELRGKKSVSYTHLRAHET